MAERLSLEFQDAPLKGITAEAVLLPSKKAGSPLVGKIVPVPEHIRNAFASEIPLVEQTVPPVEFMAKLYFASERTRCDLELAAWRLVRQSSYFDVAPAVLPVAVRARVMPGVLDGDQTVHCILMEKAQGVALDTWFTGVLENAPSLPILLHQFFSVWMQLFEFLRFLHTSVRLYHADIKPDNIIYSNNSLRVIDFNAATTLPRDVPYGTARYAPTTVLDLTRPHFRTDTHVHSAYFDLFCAGLTLLEIFVCIANKWAKSEEPDFRLLATCFSAKREASESTGQDKWDRLKAANSQIFTFVENWAKSSSLGARVSHLLKEDFLVKPSDVSQTFDLMLSPPIRDYIRWAVQDLKFTDPPGTLVGRLPNDLPKLMSQLLVNFSRNIFSQSYPLIYLDYSDHSQGYDQQAALGINVALEVLSPRQSSNVKSCLDVGCGFGTAALHAAAADFRRIQGLDNNPYFQRLAALLWRDLDIERWREYFPSAVSPLTAVYGSAADSRVRDLLTENRARFRHSGADHWVYHRADYWSLAVEKVPEGKRSDLIICNNSLHWPIIDFERMNRDCANYYDSDSRLGTVRLLQLLTPLLNHLRPGGCIVIVEPSGFFKDDTNTEEDELFHASRFTLHDAYRSAQVHARETLANHIFGLPLPMPPLRDPKFLWSSFLKLTEQSFQVRLAKFRVTHGRPGVPTSEIWRRTILGEFNMTLRHLPDEQLQRFAGEPLAEFYRQFNEYLLTASLPAEPPVEPTYVVAIYTR